MKSAYRAYWNNKMWEVTQIDCRLPQKVSLSDGKNEHKDIPVEEVKLMRNTGKKDISGQYVYQGDFIESHQGSQVLDILMQIHYGSYTAYCPADEESMENVGFFVTADDYPPMPLGPLSEYAKVIGNVCENADWLGQK